MHYILSFCTYNNKTTSILIDKDAQHRDSNSCQIMTENFRTEPFFFLGEIIQLPNKKFSIDSHAWSIDGKTLVAIQCNIIHIYQRWEDSNIHRSTLKQVGKFELEIDCNLIDICECTTKIKDDDYGNNRNKNHKIEQKSYLIVAAGVAGE